MSLRLNAADVTSVGPSAAGPTQGSQDAGSAPVPPGFAQLLQLGAAGVPAAGTNPQSSYATSANAGGQQLQTGRMRVRSTRETTDTFPGGGPAISPQLPIAVAPSPLDTAPLRMSADTTPGIAAGATASFATTDPPETSFVTLAVPVGTPAAAAGSVLPAGNAAPSQGKSAALTDASDALTAGTSTTTIPSPSGAINIPPVTGVAAQETAKSGSQAVTTRSEATTSRQSTSESAPGGTSLAQAASARPPVAPPTHTMPVGPQSPELKAAAAPAEIRSQASGQTTSTTGIVPAAAQTPEPVSLADASAVANGGSFATVPEGGFATVQNSPTGNSADGSPQGDSNSDGQAVGRADRKSRPGETQPATGDGARVGMAGWVASATARESAGFNHAEANTPVASSGGMTQMAVDRTASDSSARRLNNALQSDMGVQTDAFGRVHIQTSVTGRDLSAQISLEHTHAGSGLLAQMPALEDALRAKYGVAASISVRPDAGGTAGDTAGNGQSRQGENRPQTAAPYAVAPYSSAGTQANAQSTSMPLHGRAASAWSGTQMDSGKLDITI